MWCPPKAHMYGNGRRFKKEMNYIPSPQVCISYSSMTQDSSRGNTAGLVIHGHDHFGTPVRAWESRAKGACRFAAATATISTRADPGESEVQIHQIAPGSVWASLGLESLWKARDWRQFPKCGGKHRLEKLGGKTGSLQLSGDI